MTEILNIKYHTIRLIVIALNREKTIEDAAKALGLNTRSLYTYKKMYGIKKVSDRYQAPERQFIVLPIIQKVEYKENAIT